jgi:nucleoside-diphosphate-sugar epimerase
MSSLCKSKTMTNRKVLVIGGNRFFGKRLVHKLIENGDDVTVLNRGKLADDFGSMVRHIICDRTDSIELKNLLQHKDWDIVYDQVCFDAIEAKAACKIFLNKCQKYIFTSSMSVYGLGSCLQECDFNPYAYNPQIEVTRDQDYGEAKRQAEKEFFSQEKMPVVAVRFPIVMGPDDYTERLKFYVSEICKGHEIYFPNTAAKMSFIHAADAADGLFLLGQNNFSGPINMASFAPILIADLISEIEKVVGKNAIMTSQEKKSPYGVPSDWVMNCDLSQKLEFRPQEISQWLSSVIKASL